MSNLKVAVLPLELNLIQEGLKSDMFILTSSPKAEELKNVKPGDLVEITADKESITREIYHIDKVGPGYFRRYKKRHETRLTEWHHRILFTTPTKQEAKKDENNTRPEPKAARA